MRFLSIFIISTCLLFSIACSHSVFRSRENSERSRELAQKAIFEFLREPNFFLDMLTGKGLIKIDPVLCCRKSLSTNGKVYFDDAMYSDLLKYPLPNKKLRLVIPDSLTGKYEYTSSDMDYEHDYAIIHQFSPLLPTKEPGIYLMERYVWANSCIGSGCVRILDRGYLKFEVREEKVILLSDVPLQNQPDFIGFGSFPRKKMEEALPGEKITKFGW